MAEKTLLLLRAVLVGALVPVRRVNAQPGSHFGHPMWATASRFAVGPTALLGLPAATRVPVPAFRAAASAGPWWMWFGGLFGVLYVTTAIILAPKAG